MTEETLEVKHLSETRVLSEKRVSLVNNEVVTRVTNFDLKDQRVNSSKKANIRDSNPISPPTQPPKTQDLNRKSSKVARIPVSLMLPLKD